LTYNRQEIRAIVNRSVHNAVKRAISRNIKTDGEDKLELPDDIETAIEGYRN
jgi:hypothetical protein